MPTEQMQKILGAEDLRLEVEKLLKELGAKNIKFIDLPGSIVRVTFDWENVISFKANLSGWIYTGIKLDSSKDREYQIDFSKQP